MRSGALKIATLYIIAGVLWIMLSDKLLLAMQNHLDLDVVLFISSVKGIGYVLLTGILLYKLIRLHTLRLTESELRYRSYFDDNPNPMWIIDLRTMAFITVNGASIAYYGYNREEFLRMSVLDICPPEDINTVFTTIRELKPGMNDDLVWRNRKKDGEIVNVHIACHLLCTNKHGNVMVMVKGY